MSSPQDLSNFYNALTAKNNLYHLLNKSGKYQCPLCIHNKISFKTPFELIRHTFEKHLEIPRKQYDSKNNKEKDNIRRKAKNLLKSKKYQFNANQIIKSLDNNNNFQSAVAQNQVLTLLNNTQVKKFLKSPSPSPSRGRSRSRSRSRNRNNNTKLNLKTECVTYKDLESKINFNKIPNFTQQKLQKFNGIQRCLKMKDLEELSIIPAADLPNNSKSKSKSMQPKVCVFCGFGSSMIKGRDFISGVSQLRKHISEKHNIVETKEKRKGNKDYQKSASMQPVRCPFEWCDRHNKPLATPQSLLWHLEKIHGLPKNKAYSWLNALGIRINRREKKD